MKNKEYQYSMNADNVSSLEDVIALLKAFSLSVNLHENRDDHKQYMQNLEPLVEKGLVRKVLV